MALRAYLELIKPERTLANVYTAAAGFLFATNWPIDLQLFMAFLGGITLVIASACAANNYLDRSIDRRMNRTKKRALPTGLVTPSAALWLALILGSFGFWILATWVNFAVVFLGGIAYVDYVVAYGWAKRHTVWSTWIGTISGSMSLVAGYCAVTDRLDLTASLLFAMMVFWQMAHFYAIGIYRQDDYRSAGLPIWSVRYGLNSMRAQIIAYILLFVVTSAGLFMTMISPKGNIYLVAVLLLGFSWLRVAARPWDTKHEAAWARQVFGHSLVVIMVLPVLLAVGPHLP
ncbi:MAG TPA: heme o synthase [Candidatus Saccharimonadales bacterium]|nr:heme o synthase [Candidatus Saccharimonadales bacterium]